jgi:N-methylhydantoinase B
LVAENSDSASPGAQLDAVQLAVLSNRLDGIARAMMNALLRTSRSAIMNVARDFSCCILTADDELLSVAESIPIHTFSGPDMMARVMKEFHPDLAAGDAYLNNSPYHGNSHAADWSVLVPVFDDKGVHRFTVVAKAHVADAGNSLPTTLMPMARDVYEEGALIFPSVRFQRGYQDIDDVIRMCEVRIRVPDQWRGDFRSILGAARVGERRLRDLLTEFGPDHLARFQEEWFDYSERVMVNAISRLPAGSATATTVHDPLPGYPDGVEVNVAIKVKPNEGKVEIDLRDNIDCQPFGLNLTEATATTAGLVGLFSGLDRNVPANAGSLRRVTVLLRDNCVVGIPRHPASCSVATTNLAEHVSKCVTLALASLGDGFGLAEGGRVMPPAVASISGRDPRRGDRPFVNMVMLQVTNGPAGPRADGWLLLWGLGAAGVMLRDSVEIDELKYPLRVYEERLIPDSEGAGRFRGAPGAYVEYGPIEGAELELIYFSDGTINAPRGARGGDAGSPARQFLRGNDGDLEELPHFGHLRLRAGERVVSMCCGSGGYGPPQERDPARVASDVREGWVTAQRARETYAVVLDADGTVDAASTAMLRAEVGATS